MLVGTAPKGEPPGVSAWPVDDVPAPGRAARVVHHAVRHAVLDQRQRRLGHALGVEAARQRACEARRVGEVDARGRHALAQPAAQRAAVLGVGEAVERVGAEHRQQLADRVRLRARPGTRPAAAERARPGRPPSAPRARPARARRSRRPTCRCGRVAAAAARGDADHLHEGVGHAVRRGHAGGGRDRGLHLAHGPGAVSLHAVALGHLERGGQRGARPAPGRSARCRDRGPRRAEAVAAAGSRGRRPAGGAGDRLGGRLRGAGARRQRVGVVSFVEAPPTWPSRSTTISTLTSSIAVAWVGRERA